MPMSRIKAFIKHYLTPVSLEVSLGLAYLIMAVSMLWRPFLAGVESLFIYYGITLLTPRFVGALLALLGGILILKKYCGRKLFALLYLPLPLYSVCLAFYMIDRPLVGAAGTLGFIGLSICVARMYAMRASSRERRVSLDEVLNGRS